MSPKPPVIDTNLIIRFLTDDSPEQASRVGRLFHKVGKESLFVPDMVIAEVVYVLLSVYQLPKDQVVEKLSALINSEVFKINRSLIRRTLEIYKNHTISFIDAYLCAGVALGDYSYLYSFDKDLTKVENVTIKEP